MKTSRAITVAMTAAMACMAAGPPNTWADETPAPGPATAPSTSPTSADLAPLPSLSTGDIVFRFDAASFIGENGKNRVEFYFAIPNDQLQFTEKSGEFTGRIGIRLTVTDASGAEAGRLEDEVPVSAGTLARTHDRGTVQLVTEKMELAPGNYRLSAVVLDVTTIKKQLLAQLRGEHPQGVVEASYSPPTLTTQAVALSELQFGRLVPVAPDSGTNHSAGFEVVPNPSRLYGLVLPQLVALVEVYPGSGVSPDTAAGAWTTVYRLMRGNQEIVKEEKSGFDRREGSWSKVAQVDISSLEAGQYTLVVDLIDHGGRVLATRRGDFQVAWSPYSWAREPDEVLEDMQPILTAAELKRLTSMSRGQAESFLAAYWRERDPTPATPQNELMQEHFRRMAFARQHYAARREGGMEDRGRVYVRYGAPDDTEEGFDDVFYTKPQDTEQARSQLTPEGPSSTSGDAATDRLLDMKSREGVERAMGYQEATGKRYEVWYYDSRGTELSRDRGGVRRSPRMRFVFVDRNGTGDYSLVYSSEPGDY